MQHVGVPASGQYGDGIRRAPRFHNAKHVKLTENPARERAERHASVAGPDSASGGVHNADQHGGRSSGAFSVPVVAPMSARGSPGSIGIFALPKCAAQLYRLRENGCPFREGGGRAVEGEAVFPQHAP